MPYYQCFKTTDRTVYCSSQTFRSHQPAAQWMNDCVVNFGIKANDILGKPFESDDQPTNAVIWP